MAFLTARTLLAARAATPVKNASFPLASRALLHTRLTRPAPPLALTRVSPLASPLLRQSSHPLPAFTFARLEHTATATTAAAPKSSYPRRYLRYVLIATTAAAAGSVYLLVQDPEYHYERGAKIHTLALHPDLGGPKNLPIAQILVDDDPEKIDPRPRLVVLGSGWGAVSTLQHLDKDKYHITVVSNNNYFLFTPLLPSATVGTLELRTLIEPIRKILRPMGGHFIECEAVDVDFENKLVEVRSRDAYGIAGSNFYVPYDTLVVSVGAQSITHGVQGIEHVLFLKNMNDAIKMKKQIIDNFERASIPGTTEEERRKLLSFVICGGGPTGVEFAAELFDMINEDLSTLFPKILRDEVNVNIIQSRDHILNTFDAGISSYAEQKFSRENLNVITNARVQRVDSDKVIYSVKVPEGEPVTKELPFGLCLWSTGIAMCPFAKLVATHLSDSQKNNHALEVDLHLRLKGISDGSVYSVGDCATIENPRLLDHIMDIFAHADKDRSGSLSWNEFLEAVNMMTRKYPLSEGHLKKLNKLFAKYDEDHNGTIEMEELRKMLGDIDKKMTSLPATAQVAHQEGKYLGRLLSKLAALPPSERARVAALPDDDDNALDPFRYQHLGAFAYVGNTAVGEIGPGIKIMGGLWSLYLWRSVYLSEQVSLRTRCLLLVDWTKRYIWGRDVSRF